MKKLFLLLSICSVISAVSFAEGTNTNEKIRLLTVSNIKEVPASKNNFTGEAFVKPMFSKDSSKLSAGIVTFEAGARTAWHVHPKGQMLVILEGKGRTQQENNPVIEFQKGDVVWIPAGVKHWHGASPNFSMSHLAVAPEDENQKSTDWYEKVSNRQYKK